MAYPFCGGHEGAGVVEKVGPGVRDLEVGDHVVAAFIPGCGRCTWCARGQQNLCENGAYMMLGTQLDGTFRLHTEDAQDVGQCSLVSTRSEEHTSELQSLMRTSYAGFCWKKKRTKQEPKNHANHVMITALTKI